MLIEPIRYLKLSKDRTEFTYKKTRQGEKIPVAVTLTDGNYRPNRIEVDGKPYSMDLYAEKYRYNWEITASQCYLYYRSEDGDCLRIPQGDLALYNPKTESED